MLLAMCAAVNIHYLHWDSWGNVSNSFTTGVLSIIVLAFPMVVGVMYSHPKI
jgi:hypothetical protein